MKTRFRVSDNVHLPVLLVCLNWFMSPLLVSGHVSLTFPPARQYPLDFLNTFWTKQPCGMPKGHIKTTLPSGQAFNITWHLGYAHQGGYRLELLDNNEQYVTDLTPTQNNRFHQSRTTAQSHYIQLPDSLTCRSCTIRLLRQVPEFSPDFQFISCADVDIVSKFDYTESCSGHGYAHRNGRCTCYSKYWGDKCQYRDECDSDFDCNNGGRCIHLGGSALPRKQCFCSQNYFGSACQRRNPEGMATSSTIDLRKHVRVRLSDRVTMYFKILLGANEYQDVVEFVMQVNGTSFGALGWRPSTIDVGCKSWPFNPNALKSNIRSRRLSKRSSSSTFTITKSIDQSDSYLSAVYPSITQRPIGENSIVSSQNYKTPVQNSRTRISVVSNLQTRLRNFSPPSPRIEIIGLPKSSSEKLPLPSVTQIPRTQKPALPLISPQEWTPKDPFTPMDCSDIVYGAAQGNYHRLRDAYARGRHTPLPDALWGGRDDIIGASGWEQNGQTTLVFRRFMDSSDGPDHSVRGEMQVIWSRGQQPGEFVASPHQLEKGNPVVSDFYTLDELKYHGLGSQRGLVFIDFDAVRKEYRNGAYSQ